MAGIVQSMPSVEQLRAHFPSLQTGFAYLENAGGSQVPRVVADAIRQYMLTSYVQTGAGYPQSQTATETVEHAHEFINLVMGGEGHGKVILGSSTTALLHVLAKSYAKAVQPGTRFIICQTAHEANAGPWADLADFGFDVAVWEIDPETLQCPMEALESLFQEKQTAIVAFPMVSNLLGEIVDPRPVADLAHRYGAKVVVDAVAYAPHRPIDVTAFGADWLVYSTYKVYGPHMAALFGTNEAIAELTGPNHFFIPRGMIPYKFELGGCSHEGCAGLLALRSYLNAVVGNEPSSEIDRDTVVQAFSRMGALEIPLQKRYVDFLRSKDNLRIIGPAHADPSRVCTISFLHDSIPSPDIAAHVNSKGVGIRSGNMYAYRLCQKLGIDTSTGVVRASFAHYNTLEEIDRLCEALDEVI